MDSVRYFNELKRASELFRSSTSSALVIHHDDADGICSAAITLSALESLGIKANRVCIEKLHPAILSKIHSGDYDAYIYTDIGSGKAELIERLAGEKLVIILDHHDPVTVGKPNILNLNPELYGFSGERDVSGATATYLFAERLADVKHVAWASVVGSAELGGSLTSLNRIPLEHAVEVGDVEIRESAGRERYYIIPFGETWDRLSTKLTILGSVGYYANGPRKAVEFCIKKNLDEHEVEVLEEYRKQVFSKVMANLRRYGINHGDKVQWFSVGDSFAGMGTKVLGTFTSILAYRGFVDQRKYLVGFMNFPRVIPELGEIEGEWTKVSVRAPKLLTELINKGARPSVSKVVVEAAEYVEGYGDGHSTAASGLIPKGAEYDFLKKMEELV
ncbi:MAG: DHH family phosphoesterase [Nitrososphaerota archaeon]|nr:DHH family phosphoesterase [Aigarchaeota archaeon]MDW8076421.1 DHH family phosphoesterase [Nitrososphaerota archaeon]